MLTSALLVLAGLLLVLAVSAAIAVATGHWLARRPPAHPAPPAHPRQRHDARTALDETGEDVDNTVFPRPDRFAP
jgi:uncharacterized iron-regulated membrane protein